MPSSIRTTHHGANHDDRSPTTTIRDARSRSTPSTTRSTSRQPRGRDRHRRNSRSNSTEPRRRRGKNRSRRNARSSSTESSRPRRQNRRRRHARSSSTETSLPRGEDRRGNRGDRRGRSHGPRSRPPLQKEPIPPQAGPRALPTAPEGRFKDTQTEPTRLHNRGPPQGRTKAYQPPRRHVHFSSHPKPRSDRRATPRGRGKERRAPRPTYPHQSVGETANRNPSPHDCPTPRGRGERRRARSQHTPANMWGGPRTEASPFRTAHEAGRYGRVRVEAPKANNQLRQSITGTTEGPVFPRVRPVQRGKHGLLPVTPSFSQTSILETMYWVRQAARDRAHIARPPRGDAERSDALRDQHTPALIPPSP